MKNRYARAAATLAAAAILAASFESSAAEALAREPQRERVETIQAAANRGLLFEIRTPATTVYLFGTIHIGKPEFYPLSSQANLALADSERLYLEVNLTDTTTANAETAAAAMFPEGVTLDQKLPVALMEKVSARWRGISFRERPRSG